MKGVRLIAAALCALLVLAVPVMADGFGMGDFDSDTVNKNPQVDNPNEVTPTPSTEPPQEPTGDSTGSGTEDGAENGAGNTAGNNTGNTGEPSHELDDGLWGDWSNPSNIPGMEEPSEAQQELEEARRELEEKQQQRDEAFREAERENAALPEEEEKQKKPAGSKAADAAPTELVLPQREARTGSPVRYILIGRCWPGPFALPFTCLPTRRGRTTPPMKPNHEKPRSERRSAHAGAEPVPPLFFRTGGGGDGLFRLRAEAGGPQPRCRPAAGNGALRAVPRGDGAAPQ